MDVKCFNKGIFDSNSYVVWEGNEGVVIDVGVSDEIIMKFINENKIAIKYIILTHGHFDHVYYAFKLKEKTGAKVLIHKDDNDMLPKPEWNGTRFFGDPVSFDLADETVDDKDTITVGNLKFEVLHTPGHSMGSMCLKVENRLFSGDTLFRLSCGRTDLLGGNQEDLDNSFREKILTLDDNILVYPGHGESTTIGFERFSNPYVKYLQKK